MKPIKIICVFIGLGLINSVPGQANNMSKDILISQSRRQYQCRTGPLHMGERPRVEPSISGASVNGSYCYIPVSAGKCIAMRIPFDFGGGSGPSGMSKCDPSSITITDEATGIKYYRFDGGSSFVLQ
jgi:hypothetical protein